MISWHVSLTTQYGVDYTMQTRLHTSENGVQRYYLPIASCSMKSYTKEFPSGACLHELEPIYGLPLIDR